MASCSTKKEGNTGLKKEGCTDLTEEGSTNLKEEVSTDLPTLKNLQRGYFSEKPSKTTIFWWATSSATTNSKRTLKNAFQANQSLISLVNNKQ